MDFRFADLPDERAFGWRAWDYAPVGRVAERTLHGCAGAPLLEVRALRERVVVALHHTFSPGGGMEVNEPHGQRWEASAAELESLSPLLGAPAIAAVWRLYEDPRRWDEDAWAPLALASFRRRTEGGDDVVAASADFYELARSVTGDGRVPALTLRLGRAHDEVALDHGTVWPARDRRVDVLHRFVPPDTGRAVITDRFGEDVGRVVEAFQADRARWFAPSVRAAVVDAARRLLGALALLHGDVLVLVRDETGAEVLHPVTGSTSSTYGDPHRDVGNTLRRLEATALEAAPALAAEALGTLAARHRGGEREPTSLRPVTLHEGRDALLAWLSSTQRSFEPRAVDELFAAVALVGPVCLLGLPRRRESSVQVALIGALQAVLVDAEGDGP